MNVSKIRKMKKIRKSKKLTEITVHAAVIFDSVQRQGRLSIRTSTIQLSDRAHWDLRRILAFIYQQGNTSNRLCAVCLHDAVHLLCNIKL